MLSHFEPGVNIYDFATLRKLGPGLYKSRRLGRGMASHSTLKLHLTILPLHSPKL